MPQPSVERAIYELPEIWEPGWFPPEDHARVAELADLLPADAKTLLDVGCGNGLFVNHLAAMHPGRFTRLAGVDRSAAALRHVRPPRCQVGMEALPFADRAFDIATCMEVLEHVPVPVYPLALAELARVARRFVLVNVPWRQDLDADLSRCPSCRTMFNGDFHVRSYDETAIDSLLAPHGFRAVWTRMLGGRRVFADQLVLSRLHRWWRGRPWMSAHAICPVCGYHDADALHQELARRAHAGARASSPPPPDGFARRLLIALRPRAMTYRGVAAIYEREA